MTPHIDPPGTTNHCPMCEYNQPRVERLLKAMRACAPFVLEEYFPGCATPEYTEAVELFEEVLKEWEPKL